MFRSLAPLLMLAACGSEYTLTDRAPAPAAPPVVQETWVPVSVHDDGGSAAEAWEEPVLGLRRESFTIGPEATTPLVDFLFVVDNSVSMRSVIDRVDRAFEQLATEGVFPAEARIAVTSTIPGDLRTARRPHPATWHTSEIAHDPGFLRLIDVDGIRRVRELGPDYAEAFAADGCSAWFAPGATNGHGVPCLVAHTQSRLRAVRVEAGLTAFAQLVERSSGPIFRPGAAAHVIFVSDTHDPGIPEHLPAFEELVEVRPDLEILRALVASRGPVSALRVHAIAPREDCGEEWAHIGPVYHEVAAASGGVSLDVCSTDDFRPLVRKIASEAGRMERPVLTLARPGNGDVRVTIDEVDVPWELLGDRVIALDERDAARSDRAVVTYGLPRRPVRGPSRAASPVRR